MPLLLQSVELWQLPSTQIPLTQMWFAPYPARQAVSLGHGPQVWVLPSQTSPGTQSLADWQPPAPAPPEEPLRPVPPLASAPPVPVTPPVPVLVVPPVPTVRPAPPVPPELDPMPPVPVA